MATKTNLVFKFSTREKWLEALQKEPNPNWVKERNLGGNKKSKYLPLPIQQALADIMFREHDVHAENYNVVVNEILCTVKIQILPDYPDSEHRFITGTASKPIQQDSGSTASSFPNGKKSNALEYNSPAVRAAAISNALTTFANLFGRNLGRDINSGFTFIKIEEDEAATNNE